LNAVLPFRTGENPWSIARRLKPERFDVAVVFPNSPRSALEMWLAKIPWRVGYPGSWRRFFLSDSAPLRPGHVASRKLSVGEIKSLIDPSAAGQGLARSRYSPAAHQVFDYLELVSVLGANPTPLPPQLPVGSAEMVAVAHRFGLAIDPHQRQAHPLFGLNPGAEYGPAKRWPADRFISAAAEIQRRTNCRWLILGGPGDLQTAAQIEQGIRTVQGEFTHQAATLAPPLNLAGKTTLRELCAVLKLCRLLLTNDTGPMHLAAAVGTPVVVPFGSTSADLTGPGYGAENKHRLLISDVPCSPCFRRICPIDFRCMMGITVAQIVDAVLQSWQESPG
jgi:heptosyltransferase-2